MKACRYWFILALAVAGCTDRSGCPSGDLQTLGQSEGAAGQAASLPSATCELSEAERDDYFAARNRGLKAYCDPAAAFIKGQAGDMVDLEVCPADSHKNVRSALRAGSEIAKLEKRRAELLAEAERLEDAADGVEGDARRALLDQANARRQDARQDQNDLEALRGLATVEGWQDAPEIPAKPFPNTDET